MNNRQSAAKISGKNMKYLKNENFFETWTQDMAYILGFISADGCITDDNEFIIGIHKNDIEILEYVKKAMDLDNPIHNRNYNNREMVEIRFRSKKVCDDLRILNITSRKTYNLITPSFIPQDMISHYIRGFFDGDGSISLSNRHKQLTAECSFVSASEIYIKQICKYFNDIKINCNINIHHSNEPGKVDLYRLRFGGYRVIKLADFMYKNANFYLKRKFDKFQQFIGQRYVNCVCCKKSFFREIITQDFCENCHDLVINHNTIKLEQLTGIRSETIRSTGINDLKKLLVNS